jgi:transcriptional regulator with XRE-family HTH domain
MVTMLGQRLKQCREWAGLSQNALAKKADVPRPTISELESGNQTGLTLDNAKKLAHALGVTIDFLAGPMGEKETSSEHTPVSRALVPA